MQRCASLDCIVMCARHFSLSLGPLWSPSQMRSEAPREGYKLARQLLMKQKQWHT